MNYRVISIGALSRHELWPKARPDGAAHATTTLIRSGDRTILVDPALPAQALVPRLDERSGLEPSDVTTIFLTNFRPAHRMGLTAFEHAEWLIFEEEREQTGRQLIARFEQEQDDQLRRLIEFEISLLQRCKSAPEKLAPGVDLFPSAGFTPGTCGLLISQEQSTTLVAGDAIATQEHLQRAQVLRGAFDIEQAQESMAEALEIADFIIPGHDNLTPNPSRRGF